MLERLDHLLMLQPATSNYAATTGRSQLRRAPRAPWDLVLLPCSISINLGGLEANVGLPPEDLNLQLLPSHLRVSSARAATRFAASRLILRPFLVTGIALRLPATVGYSDRSASHLLCSQVEQDETGVTLITDAVLLRCVRAPLALAPVASVGLKPPRLIISLG